MIYKRCVRCHKRIPSGTTCECYTKIKRVYAKAEGTRKEYHTQRWKNMRLYIMAQYNGIDIYMLYKHGKAVPADTVHHIERTVLRPDLFYDANNLMPVSDAGHKEIHYRYKAEGEDSVKNELHECINWWKKTGGTCKL